VWDWEGGSEAHAALQLSSACNLGDGALDADGEEQVLGVGARRVAEVVAAGRPWRFADGAAFNGELSRATA